MCGCEAIEDLPALQAALLQGSEMKRMKPDSGDDDEDLWGASNGWDDSDEDDPDTPLPTPNGEDVSMETWIIMELCNRGSLRVSAYANPDIP